MKAMALAMIILFIPACAAWIVRENIAEQDNSVFVRDLIHDDGSTVEANTVYTKGWVIKNTGKVIWKDRTLREIPKEGMPLNNSVTIGETPPGNETHVIVSITTPSIPGHYRSEWKMYGANNKRSFASKKPLYWEFTVR